MQTLLDAIDVSQLVTEIIAFVPKLVAALVLLVANVISGVSIFWDKPFVVGDWIEVEGQFGRVNNITLRSTRIRTPRNTCVVIPNK